MLCFEISSAIKTRLGWGPRGCGDSTTARDPIGDGSIALSQVVEAKGLRGGWQGTHKRLPLVSLGKCLSILQYSKSDAAHILSDSGHQR